MGVKKNLYFRTKDNGRQCWRGLSGTPSSVDNSLSLSFIQVSRQLCVGRGFIVTEKISGETDTMPQPLNRGPLYSLSQYITQCRAVGKGLQTLCSDG